MKLIVGGSRRRDRGPVGLVRLWTDERGLPLGYTIVPANEREYEPLADLLTGTPAEVVIADKGLWGRGYQARLAADQIGRPARALARLRRPLNHNSSL